jgi:aspartyl-tRNA(Asn)/glutamyl-tRNA(Gln) amidotransferase subunit A
VDVAFSDIASLAPRLQRGEVSSVELTQACLERIRAQDEQINAFQIVLEASALEEARRADQEISGGAYRGPLHGIPIAHKDLYYTAGTRTTAGSKILEQFVPDYDATVVSKLKDAGSVLLGKLNMHEFAAGGTNNNPWYGPTRNPWALDRIPGGSSGGSAAALAAGMAFGTTGSDTAGSIRIPSHCCGTTGLKPTFGRVSKYGVVPLSWTLDHTGPMTRSVRDAALMLQVMAGFDPLDPDSVEHQVDDFVSELDAGVRGLTIGVPRNHFNQVLQPDIERAWQSAIQTLVDLGAQTVEVEFPSFGEAPAIGMIILRAEMAAFHQQWFAERPDDYSPAIRQRLAENLTRSAVDYVHAQRARDMLYAELRSALALADVIVTPTAPLTATPIGHDAGADRLVQFTYPFNLTRCPALSLPCGFDSLGLPIGLQIAAGPWQEALILRVGNAYQQATDWHTRHPTPAATVAAT